MDGELQTDGAVSAENQRSITQSELDELLAQQERWSNNRRDAEPPNFANRLIAGLKLPEGYKFVRTNLSGTIFRDVDLTNCRFGGANLAGADFHHAKMSGCIFYDCVMTGVALPITVMECTFLSLSFADCKFHENEFVRCTFDDVRFSRTIIEYISFGRTSRATERDATWTKAVTRRLFPQHCKFIRCNFTEVERLLYIDFDDAKLTQCNLENVDLRGCKNFRFDQTDVKGARLPNHSTDPWLVITRNYTGVKMVFMLLFLSLFFAPYLAKAAALILISNLEPRLEYLLYNINDKASPLLLDHGSVDLQSICAKIGCVREPIWRLLLGPDASFFLQATAFTLFAYNVARALLTWRVSPMREEQNVTHITPRYLPDKLKSRPWTNRTIDKVKDFARSLRLYAVDLVQCYAPLWRIHQFISFIFVATLVLAAWHLVQFFQQDVLIPQHLLTR